MADGTIQVMQQTALEDFDRRMRFWEVARSASREAEDRYIEAAWAPALREDTRRQRRALILSAVATVAMSVLGLRPTEIPALGLPLDGVRGVVIIGAAVAFTLYFWVEFLTYAARDFQYWHHRVKVAYRELTASLDREEGQARETFHGQGIAERFLSECKAKKSLYERSVLGSGAGRWAPVLGIGRLGWIEHRLPSLVALAAVAAGVWSVVREAKHAF